MRQVASATHRGLPSNQSGGQGCLSRAFDPLWREEATEMTGIRKMEREREREKRVKCSSPPRAQQCRTALGVCPRVRARAAVGMLSVSGPPPCRCVRPPGPRRHVSAEVLRARGVLMRPGARAVVILLHAEVKQRIAARGSEHTAAAVHALSADAYSGRAHGLAAAASVRVHGAGRGLCQHQVTPRCR